ncbi:MAG: DUF4097 family beta strand repeat protein, partial [Candidatus Aminicenantes bacterium]|nr:DUF4097 family beta strand repeat protein [Candidatus Aminicenantes bacterium]
MKKIVQLFLMVFLLMVFAGTMSAAEDVVIPLSNPSAPCTIKASLFTGGITVTGYNGKDVIVNADLPTKQITKKKDDNESKGLKRISATSMNLVIEEEDNVVKISSSSIHRKINLVIKVPFKSSLYLSCHHNGNIVVDQVTGEIEAKNHHGSIDLSDISGHVMANTHHGYIKVGFNKITPNKPMSFSTYHGNIDITFPASIKASLKMKSERGDIYTDFDIRTQVKSTKTEKKNVEGKYVVRIDKSIHGNLNGGGPEIFFETHHGNIYIK